MVFTHVCLQVELPEEADKGENANLSQDEDL